MGVKVGKEPDWESWIDQQISEAAARGDFDNLPGKGMPLSLEPNPYAADRELAFKILRDAGYAPEWIELDKSIRGRLEQARATLARSWKWYQANLARLDDRTDKGAEAERGRLKAGWQRAVLAFQAEIKAINADIAALNLKVPGPRFQRARLDEAAERELITGKRL
jgi:DnaJ family protein C protein 28